MYFVFAVSHFVIMSIFENIYKVSLLSIKRRIFFPVYTKLQASLYMGNLF